MIEEITTAKLISYLIAARPTVNKHQYGVFLASIKIGRIYRIGNLFVEQLLMNGVLCNCSFRIPSVLRCQVPKFGLPISGNAAVCGILIELHLTQIQRFHFLRPSGIQLDVFAPFAVHPFDAMLYDR